MSQEELHSVHGLTPPGNSTVPTDSAATSSGPPAPPRKLSRRQAEDQSGEGGTPAVVAERHATPLETTATEARLTAR